VIEINIFCITKQYQAGLLAILKLVNSSEKLAIALSGLLYYST
jgi:hypothetical protein